MEEKVVKSKLVNFLVADVEVDYEGVGDFYDVAGSGHVSALAGVLEGVKEVYGGLWVGGKMTLTNTAVYLNANAMNRMVQDGTLDIRVPLGMIRKVTLEGGFITKIVCLDTDAGSILFRCYGAKDIVALIEKSIQPRVSTSVLKRGV